MTIWARIATSDDTIHELIDFDPVGTFVEDADFRFQIVPADVEDWVSTGWLFTGDEPHPASIEVFYESVMKDRVNNRRWGEQTKGVVVDGNTYKSDPSDLNIMNSAISGGNIFEQIYGVGTFSTDWDALSGFVNLNLNGLVGVGMFALQYTQACFTRAKSIREDIVTAMGSETDPYDKLLAMIEVYNAEIGIDWPVNNNTPPEE